MTGVSSLLSMNNAAKLVLEPQNVKICSRANMFIG